MEHILAGCLGVSRSICTDRHLPDTQKCCGRTQQFELTAKEVGKSWLLGKVGKHLIRCLHGSAPPEAAELGLERAVISFWYALL